MIPLKEAILYIGMGALFTHELDAMTHHEWRMLPLLSGLVDDAARPSFVVLHVPLFAALIALVAARHEKVRRIAGLVIAGFLIVHGVLHTVLAEPGVFGTPLSHALIYGGGLLGIGHLALALRDRRRARAAD